MAKLRQGEPWMAGDKYGSLLPPLSLDLVVAEIERSVAFYRDVLQAVIRYYDVDFAAMRVGPAEVMLHADHTHDSHAWHADLTGGAKRGLGVHLRILGIDPDALEQRARQHGAQVLAPTTDKGHGWREVFVLDPDGYHWTVGVLNEQARQTARPATD